ncbi:unnamed protein product [Periconia digitata]|uniref:Uncharacterized protein n=1 Tax=Periconia digitata TaxID=1303443 RepID=A0A9W4UDW4_9PLEO|nr:unnamed protein product [Periconia digitata]
MSIMSIDPTFDNADLFSIDYLSATTIPTNTLLGIAHALIPVRFV